MWGAWRAPSEGPEPVTWHRKWVLLAVALGWLFLVRYRAMGWLLSQALTLHLRWSSARLRGVCVRIEFIRLSPLQCGRVELSCESDWCVVVTSTTVTTHLKEFFQSYGQKKLLGVVLGDITADVRRVDLDVVRAFVRAKNDAAMAKKTAAKSHANGQESSPMGFMRFVDVSARCIAVRVDAFDLSFRLRCSGFYMSIPRVYIEQNYLHLSAEASDIKASCHHLQAKPHEPPLGSILECDDCDEDAEGVSALLPRGVAVLSIRLSDTTCIGCALQGTNTDTAVFRVATAFLLHLQSKYADLLQSELLPLPAQFLHGPASTRPAASAFALTFEQFPLEIRIRHSAQATKAALMELRMHVNHFSRARSVDESSVTMIAAPTSRSQTLTELRVQAVSVVLHSSSRQEIASITQAMMRLDQTDGKSGVLVQISNADVALDPSSCAASHSLIAFSEVMDAHETRLAPLIRDAIKQRWGRESAPPTAKGPVHLSLRSEIQSCSLQIWVLPLNAQAAPDITASFDGATISSVLPPRSSASAVVHEVSVARLQATLSDQAHSVVAHDVCVLSTTKPTPKTTELRVQCGEASINGLRRGQVQPPADLPAMCALGLDVHLDECSQSAVHAIAMAELDVSWSHERHLLWLQHAIDAVEILERARTVLLRAEELPSDTRSAASPPRALQVNAVVTDGRVRIRDIANVASSIELVATQAKVSVEKSRQQASAAALQCGFLKMLWDDDSPVAEVSGVSIQHQVQDGADYTDTTRLPTNSDVVFSDLKLWCVPDRRLLLLLLRMEELTRGKEPHERSSCSASTSSSPSTSRSAKQTTRQGVGFTCGSILLTIHPGPPSAVGAESLIGINAFEFKGVLAKSHAIGEPLLRYLQVVQLSDDARSQFAHTLEQTMEIDSTLTIGSIDMGPTAQRTLARVRELHVKLALSDVARRALPQVVTSTGSLIPLRITLFDVSSTTSGCRFHVDRTLRSIADTSARVLSSVLQTGSGPSESPPTGADDVRLRYVGTLDVGVTRFVACSPCGSSWDELEASDARLLQLSVREVGLKTRQLQKASLQLEELTVWLVDHDDDDETQDLGPRAAHDFVHRLLFVPCIRWEAVVHYKPRDDDSDSDGDEFGVSFELVFSGKTLSSNTNVPDYAESLLSLHWDHVYPLLVMLCTDDDLELQPGSSSSDEASSEASEDAPSSLSARCRGVQWNISVDVLQVTWWDSITQDVGVLIVANDLLAHGSARQLGTALQWTVLESTIFLDLFRGYLLREGALLDDANPDEDSGSHSEPFETMPASRFFFETTGTSYREYYSSPQSPGKTAADLADALFGEPTPALVERLHETFVPIKTPFPTTMPARLHRMDALPNAPSFPPPSSAQVSSALGSVTVVASSTQPKSPRGWAQSMRAKVARLKRRTSSMDNLLLDDGSCPIQVDSMKLLWTIETRDCAFYMIEVTTDSISVILDARKHQRSPVSQAHSSSSSAFASSSSSSSAASLKASSSRPPTNTTVTVPMDSHARSGRRASTRETLLELLHEGKLGKKAAVSPTNEAACGGDKLKTLVPLEETTLPTRIAFKKYTVDVHDAQINMLEDASRSSALVASKHIHFEIGYDDLQSTTIATLSFDCVTAHVAPIDVDISAGVLWYSHSRSTTALPSMSPPRTPSAGNTTLLKRVLEECSLTTCYSQSITSGAIAVEADLSFLQLTTDRHQFYQLLNVLRHVLLAPPTAVQRTKRGAGLSRRLASTDNVRQASETEPALVAASSPSPHPHHQGSTKKLHALIEEEMRIRDSKSLGTSRGQHGVLKLTSFRVVGCTFRLRASPETSGAEHEFGEIRVEGLTGSHSFFTNQCTKLTLNLQWIEINNLRPGSSSIAFEDPTSVLKAKLLQEQRLETTGRKLAGGQKCMLTIRAESGPPTRVLGQKLRVLDVLEVSIFPDVPNMVVIQLAADFYEVLYKFFFEQVATPATHDSAGSEHLLFGRKAHSTSNMSQATHHNTSAPSPFARSRPPSNPTSPQASAIISRRKSIQISSISVVTTESSSTSVTSPTAGLPSPTSPQGDYGVDEEDAEGRELFYFKYVRIGNLRLRINCNGFFVNLSNFDLDLPPYVCQSKLCTWKKLLHRFESHLKWYLTKESASTGLSHFKNRLLRWTPIEKKEKQTKKDGDTANMNAQVLFGPYSGGSSATS
ncbi:hypothetical protein P43SY_009511 [Pythium insidiosum]|uniref:FMP27 C-terminal domain-containing protein n=1 Tax=Pythium insidiosum TaxID=114742 RepID=A0AAD5M165_PYTIN|nr:hypothetical protein P43SY_009511 [Pythium insidiosum]